MILSVRILLVGPVVALAVAHGASAFTTPKSQKLQSLSTLKMVPRFDPEKQRWEATTKEEKEGGYGLFETVVRNGPLPFFQRVINQDAYEQGVLKLMAVYKMPRREAQGNMDASLENPADWAYQKLQEKSGGPKKDYAKSPSDKQFVLAGTWSLIVFWFFGTLIFDSVVGKYTH
jgi:hypothetical protein